MLDIPAIAFVSFNRQQITTPSPIAVIALRGNLHNLSLIPHHHNAESRERSAHIWGLWNYTSLTRPASLGKPEVEELRKKGVSVVAADLVGSEDQLVKILSGTDVLISTVSVTGLLDQIPLADAAKVAGVKRFVPCFFATIAPPKGVLDLRYLKEEILLHVKKIHLPYTVIDVGWWYQLSLPRLPSGRIDYAVTMPVEYIAGDGNAPSALTDMRDVGNYTARIIRDPRTLNKMVLVYGEVLSQNQVFDLLENLSGEQLERHYEVTALTRPSSLQKPEVLELKRKGVHVVSADFDGPDDQLAKLLTGIDVLIATINATGNEPDTARKCCQSCRR
ncbi:putative isoflavone reductase family protein [Ilyonectria robusta]